jgi:chaperonin GroES
MEYASTGYAVSAAHDAVIPTQGDMMFQLNDDRIAVIADEVEETSASGLILTDSAMSPLRWGVVSHVGIGHISETLGEIIAPLIEQGDRVFFHRASGQPLTIEGVEYVILAPREIIGRLVED